MITARKVGFFFLGLILLGAFGFGAFAHFASYSDGYRVGTLLKLSRKGVLLKTWEGELSQGFLEQNPDLGIATRSWPFSVSGSDEKTVKDLQRAMDTGARVKLHYNEKYFKLPWVGDTKYVVYQVETVQ